MASSKNPTTPFGIPIDIPVSKNTLNTIEEFERESNEPESATCCDNICCSCFNQWWNVKYNHQRVIINIVEKTMFHIGIIILVLIDCILVVAELMLDFILLNEKCDNNKNEHGGEEKSNPKLELAIELLHYASIFLLAVFVLEVTVKIYAFGKKWWDFRQKKMEWLDAIIVIVSFIVDIYFLKQKSVIAEISLLFISFRLWRIIRIINSVAQSIRSQDETAKKHLAHTYIQIIELLLNVSSKKTEVATELRQNLTVGNFDKIIEKFTSIDQLCRSILEHCPKPSSRNAVTDIAQHLQDALEKIRLTSSTLSLENHPKKKGH